MQKLNLVMNEYLFKNEIVDLEKKFKININLFSFNDFLSDNDLEIIDDKVYNKLNSLSYSNYSQHSRLIKETKLRFLIEKIKKKDFNSKIILLNNSIGYPLASKKTNLYKIININYNIKNRLRIIYDSLNLFFLRIKKIPVFIYLDGNRKYYVLYGFNRIKNDYEFLEIKYYSFNELKLFSSNNPLKFWVEGHKWKEIFYDFNLVLLVDNFMPPNYTKSYFHIYGKNVIHGVKNELETLFFIKNKIKTFKLPFYNEKKINFKNYKPSAIKSFTLILQTCSEWTSLINRSDIFKLIINFCEVAKCHKNLTFYLRPHPSTNHKDMNGKFFSKRLKKYIRSLGVSNIKISKNNDDIKNSEVLFSEYSTMLLEYINEKKIVSLNFSGRRNFFNYFNSKGVLSINSKEKLSEFFKIIIIKK
ncbi:hypothetical protein N9E14_01210 [Flavobacteriaceae bacterium]|nr:hypothetical protein [Flavobacteriaceae bacterium]